MAGNPAAAMAEEPCCLCVPCCQNTENTASPLPDPPLQSIEETDNVIAHIKDLMGRIKANYNQGDVKPENNASGEHSTDNLIHYGNSLIARLSRKLKCHMTKKCLIASLDQEVALVADSLGKFPKTALVGVTLAAIVHLLQRAIRASSNVEKCLHHLEYMCLLAEKIKDLSDELKEEELREVMEYVIKATTVFEQIALQRSPCERYIWAYSDANDLEILKTRAQYIHIRMNELSGLRVPKIPKAKQPQFPPDAVGIEEALNDVVDLLQMQNELHSSRIVIIYGLGGMGKSTLASAVYSKLDLTGYRFCRIVIGHYKDSSPRMEKLVKIQKQILYQVYDENWDLHNTMEGREKLLVAFRKAETPPLFLLIDDVASSVELEEILPVIDLPKGSRFLVTTRMCSTVDLLERSGIKVEKYRLDCLRNERANMILSHYTEGCGNTTFPEGFPLEEFLQICGGVPYLLKYCGMLLFKHLGNEAEWKDLLIHLKRWKLDGYRGRENVPHRLFLSVFENLNTSTKNIFLDIAIFFHNWTRSRLVDIFGEIEIKMLEDAAFVITTLSGLVTNAAVVQAIVRLEALQTRFCRTIWNSCTPTQDVRGIVMDRPYASMDARSIDLISNTLTILCGINIQGTCTASFPSLRILHLPDAYTEFPIDLTSCPTLAYLRGTGDAEVFREFQLPTTLKILEWSTSEQPGITAISIACIAHLDKLTELKLEGFTLDAQYLVEHESNMKLRSLHFCHCKILASVMHWIESLSSLETLSLRACFLESLPDSIQRLRNLRFLDISDCRGLGTLPSDMDTLSSLAVVKASGCIGLNGNSMDTFLRIRNLKFLELGGSPYLEERWTVLQQQHPLVGVVSTFTSLNDALAKIASTLFLSKANNFVEIDSDGETMLDLLEDPVKDEGSRVCLIMTQDTIMAEEMKQKVEETKSQGYIVVYLDVDYTQQSEEEAWMQQRNERVKATLQQLPLGCYCWNSRYPKTSWLLAYCIWKLLCGADDCCGMMVLTALQREELFHPESTSVVCKTVFTGNRRIFSLFRELDACCETLLTTG